MTDSFPVRREVFLALIATMACATPRAGDAPPPTSVVIASAAPSAAPAPPPLVPPPAPSATAAMGPEIEIVDEDSEREELARLPGPACEESLDLPMPQHDEPSAPYVRIGPLTVSGRTAPEDIRRTIRLQARSLLGHCATLMSPEMGEPRVVARLAFDQDGKVIDPPGKGDNEGPEIVQACVLAALKTLTYPPPIRDNSGPARVVFVVPLHVRHTRPRYDRKEMRAWANRINAPCKKKPPPSR